MNDRLKASFELLHASEDLKARTRARLYQQAAYTPPRRYGKRILALACALLLTVGLTLGGWLYFTPVSAIDIDINPSLKLSVNRFDRVIAVEGRNADGQTVAEGLSLQFMDYAGAVEAILADESIQAYLDQGKTLSIRVICDDEAQSEKMLAQLEDCTSGHRNVTCHAGEEEHHANSEKQENRHGHGHG